MESLGGVWNVGVADDAEFRKQWERHGGQALDANSTVAGFFAKTKNIPSIYLNRDTTGGIPIFMLLRHELGHSLYYNAPPIARSVWSDKWHSEPTFDRFTDYAKSNEREGFAEAYSAYIGSHGKVAHTDWHTKNTFDIIDQFIQATRNKGK